MEYKYIPNFSQNDKEFISKIKKEVTTNNLELNDKLQNYIIQPNFNLK